MVTVEKSLRRYRASEVHTIALPGLPEKGDASDWFRTGTRERFDEIVYEEFHIESLDRQASEESVDIHAAEAREREIWTPEQLVDNSSIRFPDGFLHGEIFPRGTISMIYGPSGSGKSYLVMYLGAQIALGALVHRLETSPGRVLFLSEEMGPPELKLRSEIVWTKEMRTEIRDRFTVKFFSGFDFGGKDRKNESINDFNTICTKHKPDIVFVDSLTKIHHEEENSNPRMGQVMQNLETAARNSNVAIVVVHHMGKAGPEPRAGKDKARGASAIMAAMNDALSVECVSAAELRSVIAFEKTRSIIGSAPPSFTFSQMAEESGRTVHVKNKRIPAVTFLIGDYTKKDRVEDTALRDVRGTLEGLVGERISEGSVADEVSRVDLIARLRTENPDWTDNYCDQAIMRAVGRKMIERRGRGTYGPARN
jgi:hypothetical protein